MAKEDDGGLTMILLAVGGFLLWRYWQAAPATSAPPAPTPAPTPIGITAGYKAQNTIFVSEGERLPAPPAGMQWYAPPTGTQESSPWQGAGRTYYLEPAGTSHGLPGSWKETMPL